MTKLIAMTTAATLALSGAAFAQDVQEADAPSEDAVVTETEVETEASALKTAPATDNAAATQEAATQDKTIMHTAAAAGIVSMDGGEVDTSAPEAPAVAELNETLAQDQAMTEAREMFETADANGDDVLSADEFINALRPVADAIEQTKAPIVAEVEVEAPVQEPAQTADAESNADADAQTAEAETDAETTVETRELTPSDYLTAKFEMISGVDGQLSLDELETAHAADFDAADTDGDDVLDGEEAEAFAALTTGRAAY